MTDCHRKLSGRFAAFALAAVLAGCVAQLPAPTAEEPAAAPAAAAPATPEEPEQAGAPADTPTPAAPAIEVPTPEKLLGMDRGAIVKLMGRPDFRRHDVPALLMRYRDARCILDLFLYPASGARKADGPAVEHVEARGVDGSRIATKTCIESVMKSRAAKAPG